MVGPAFLTSYYNYNPEKAGRIASLAPLAAIFMPILGKIVDKFGKIHYWNFLSSVLHFFSCLLMPYINPSFCFFMYGLGYASRVSLTFPILDHIIIRP